MSTSPVAIVSDSTHYLPRPVTEDLRIGQVSLYVGWDNELEREVEIDLAGFYARLALEGDLPATSQPSIGDFLAVWEPLIEQGMDVVSVHLSGGISGTYEAARQAKGLLFERGLGDRVEVIDSKTSCGGLGMLLLAGSAAARAGADSQAVASRIAQTREQLRIWFCLDTLEYLRRGGRIGNARAWVGSTLRIKPILSLESEITPVERVRTSARAFERMVSYAHELHDAGADAWVVQHIRNHDAASALIERCREIFEEEPLFISEVGPVIGTYTGPGLLGVGAVPRALVV